MPTSAALPDTITPRTRARRHTRRDKPHPAQRHVSIMAVSPKTARANKPRTAHRTLTRSIRHTSPRDVPHSHDNTALRKHHCTHTAARTPRTARHTAPRTPHTAHRKSHPVTPAASTPHSPQSCQAAQRRRDATGELVDVHPQQPAGYKQPSRHTMAPDAAPTQASRPQRISAHRIA
jgi:hypothetical protein